ncbi:helix-turn-helix transcriptional regulator [Pontiella sulfatireligans]|uniref:Helix-turn-helix domain-containing protein n=1 Tax=Pontiella sulfatireligans TaxID=2750658 RepID=A0A6C2UG99_9BACT|nr:helix-turn-helix domain-containing protein [Pontiella sulfatireligans]VGO19148.1 hypothetical protein SCARR_01205 [Pontiella sulfatireligans]
MTATNDEIIQAVFTAADEAKTRALAILKGEADPSSLRGEGPSGPEADLRPPSSEIGPLLMGMGEAARFLGVSRATLWRMIRDQRLSKVEIYHNAFRLRRSDILELVNRREVKRDKYRFRQLYQLAHGGDMVAKANLWLEFEFAYDHDPLPDFMKPPALPVSQASCLPCQENAVADPATNNPQPSTPNRNAEGGAQ